MKYVLIFILFISNLTYSQFNLETNFNSVSTGRNQSLSLNYYFKKFQVGFGAKYNFNKLTNFPQNVFYKKTFYAINDSEHWGLEFNLKHEIFNLKNVLKSYIFFNSQYTKSHIRFETYYAVSELVPNPTSELDYLYVKHVDFIGPIIALENNIGLAFEIFIFDNVYLSQKFGIGLMLFKNLDKNTILVGGGNWVFSEMLSFGIGYKFEKKKK